MGIDITAEVRIARARDEVAAFVLDPSNDPAWIGGVSSAHVQGGEALAVGARVERVASFLGRRIEYVNEIDSLEPGARLEMHSVAGPFPMQISYEFEDAGGGGTLVRDRVRGDATGFFSLASPVLARMVKRNVRGDLERLRELLERTGA